MMNKYVPYGEIPFFWSRQYNKSVQHIGCGEFNEVHIEGNVDKCDYVAYYINAQDKVVAVAGMSRPKATLTYLEAMRQGVMPSGSAFKSGTETWQSVQAKLKLNVGGSKCKRANCCQKKSVV